MFKSIGTTEIVVLGIIVLLVFGGRKIPDFFKGLGDAVKEFKKASDDSKKEDE